MASGPSRDTQTVLLYYVKFTGKEQTKDEIVKALSAFAKVTRDDINIQRKQDRYSAYIELPTSAAIKVCQALDFKVAGVTVHVRRYFSDFQIFINKLNDEIDSDKVKAYFEKFGKVEEVQVTEAHSLENGPNKMANRHCYVKFSNEDDVDRCLYHAQHSIGKGDVKLVRTYRIGENEDSDRKIFVKFIPHVQNPEDIEKHINDRFTKFGKLRERVKIEPLGQGNASKAIVTYINQENCQEAIQKFGTPAVEHYRLELRPFISKENNTHRIFVAGLKPTVTDIEIEKGFSMFGKISEQSIMSSKKGQSSNAVIGYEEEASAKRALIENKEHQEIRAMFLAEPFVTIHMNAKDRKELDEFGRKNMPVRRNMPPQNVNYNNMPPMNYGGNMPHNFNPATYNQGQNMNMNMNMNMGPMYVQRSYQSQNPTNNNS